MDHKDPEVCQSVHPPEPRMLENIITRGLKLESNQLPTQLIKFYSICTVVTIEAPEATLHLHINAQKNTKYHKNTDLLFTLLGLKGQRTQEHKTAFSSLHSCARPLVFRQNTHSQANACVSSKRCQRWNRNTMFCQSALLLRTARSRWTVVAKVSSSLNAVGSFQISVTDTADAPGKFRCQGNILHYGIT